MKARASLTIAVLTLAALGIAGCSSTGATIETVSPSAAAETISDEATEVIVLDIRTPEEFSEGIIEGAMNIDFYESDFAAQLDSLDKDASYVVYCRSGNRSEQALPTFQELGFADVSEIDGGIAAWYNEGLPILLP